MPRVSAACAALLVAALVLPDVTLAAEPAERPAPTLLLPSDFLWTLIVGGLVPLVTYVLNHHAPWWSERVKGIVHGLAASVAGVLAELLATGEIGLNEITLQYVLGAIAAAAFAHGLLYRPSGINAALGGGSNARRS